MGGSFGWGGRAKVQADVELAKKNVRAGEAARDKERDSFAAVAGAENRRRASAALETASTVAKAMTQEVLADAERLEGERGTMLVPQVSALVGCQVTEQACVAGVARGGLCWVERRGGGGYGGCFSCGSAVSSD